MKLKLFIFILTLSASLSRKPKKHRSTSSESSEDSQLSSNDDQSAPTQGQASSSRKNYFSCKGTLRRNFATEITFSHTGRNVVCSPVSALLPLGKLVLGVEGPSRPEVLEAIGDFKKSALTESFNKLIKNLQYIDGVKLDIASRIYVSEQSDLLPKFTENAKAIFSSGVEKISFEQSKQAADEINGWVSRQTNGMIPLLLQPNQIDKNTSLIIVNAIYFKGKWKYPFSDINVGDFYAPTGPKRVQLMSRQPFMCRYTKSDVLNAEIAEIPYQGSEVYFVVVLPLVKAGLPLLLNQLKLAPNLLNSALKRLKPKLLNVTLPKFSITTGFDLKDMYEKIGVKKMMSAQSGLKRIVKDRELQVSSAIQKSVIEVHERGTEASAASAVILNMMSVSKPPKTIHFTADHPFLFYVQSHAEQMFAGIYSDP